MLLTAHSSAIFHFIGIGGINLQGSHNMLTCRLLLGYDNGVIGGVTAMHDFQLKFFEDSVYSHNYPEEYAARHPERVAQADAAAADLVATTISPYCKYSPVSVLMPVISSGLT